MSTTFSGRAYPGLLTDDMFYSSSSNDKELGVKVAIKKFSRPFQSLIHAKRTFREIKLLRHMDHENVIDCA